MDNAEVAATIDFLIKYSGSTCSICGRELIAMDELKQARFGNPGDVIHRDCWPAYELIQAVVTYFNKRGAAHAERKGNEDVAAMADALSDYGHALALRLKK